MFKIIIFSDSFKHFDMPIKEYEKRLSREVEIVKLKPSKKQEVSQIIFEETSLLKEKLEKIKWYKILLYINAKEFSTHDFLNLCESKIQTHSEIVFIIWWAYWVELSMIEKLIDLKLSFSPMTFPHSMAYLILLEQIYRILTLKKWSSYHH